MSDSAELGIQWAGGGEGRLVSLSGDVIVVRSTKPFAPGSRQEGSLGTGDTLRLKSHRCRREDGVDALIYVVDGRALDMSRALRFRIDELLGAGRGQPPTDG